MLQLHCLNGKLIIEIQTRRRKMKSLNASQQSKDDEGQIAKPDYINVPKVIECEELSHFFVQFFVRLGKNFKVFEKNV